MEGVAVYEGPQYLGKSFVSAESPSELVPHPRDFCFSLVNMLHL